MSLYRAKLGYVLPNKNALLGFSVVFCPGTFHDIQKRCYFSYGNSRKPSGTFHLQPNPVHYSFVSRGTSYEKMENRANDSHAIDIHANVILKNNLWRFEDNEYAVVLMTSP